MKITICSKCGSTGRKSAKFCDQCGTMLPDLKLKKLVYQLFCRPKLDDETDWEPYGEYASSPSGLDLSEANFGSYDFYIGGYDLNDRGKSELPIQYWQQVVDNISVNYKTKPKIDVFWNED